MGNRINSRPKMTPVVLFLHEKLLSKSLWLESELEQELELYDPIRRVKSGVTRSSLKSAPPPPPPSSSSRGRRKYVFSDPRRESTEEEYAGWITEDHLRLIHLDVTTPSGR